MCLSICDFELCLRCLGIVEGGLVRFVVSVILICLWSDFCLGVRICFSSCYLFVNFVLLNVFRV